MLWVGTALVFSALFFMPGLLEQFETPKIEAVRVCGLGALALALLGGRAGRPRGWRPLDRAVVAWLAVEIVATALSISPRVSLVGETRQREGLLTSTALAGLYFAARDAFARPGRMRAALGLVLALASLVGLYAIVQAAGHDPFQWRREAFYAGVYVRPFATLGHPNLLGVLTAAAAPIALALAVARRRGAWPWLLGGAATLLLMATVLTFSRAAWLGVAVGLAVAASLALREQGRARIAPRALVAAVAAVMVVVVTMALAGWGGLLARRFAELFTGGGGSGSSRLEIWRTALAAWRARPLFGQGPDLFEMVFPRFQTPAYWRYEWSGLPFHAHSIYLHTLATRGVLGLLAGLAWAATLVGAAAKAWRRAGDAALPGLVPASVGALAALAVAGAFGALGITGALMVVLISALLATAAAATPPLAGAVAEQAALRVPPARERPKPVAIHGAKGRRRGGDGRGGAPGPPGQRRWPGRLAAAAVSLVAFLWCFTELRASRAASAAQAFMTSAPTRAAQASGYAVALAPHDDRLWRMRAGTLLWLTTVTPEPTALLGEAETAARRAVDLAPARAENHLILARALAAREAQGDTAARAGAEAEFRASLTLAPVDGLSLMEVADYEAMAGRPAPALAAARRAVTLYPDEAEVLAVLAHALLSAGERDSARVALERALRAGWQPPGGRREVEQQLRDLATTASRPPPRLNPR
jgi:putative inorganic carbon (HCO3(-)) transporter